MKIINLTYAHPYKIHAKTSFALNFKYFKEIWIFNCNQGCQHILANKNIRISQIFRIIITELHAENISGLLGLLSSLNLIQRNKTLHIYSPKGLEKYLELGKKYSQTNFNYRLYLHTLKTGLIINSYTHQVYTFANNSKFEFSIIDKEKYGKFKLNKAKIFNLILGPLYSKLKKGSQFLLPDGYILDGNYFTENNNYGIKVSFILNKYHKRNSVEISVKCKILQNISY
uniref:Ribonuclease Z n=1 Tax=Anunuuluaehu liula TaxID=3049639 RepID=UPI0030025BA7